MRTLADLRSHPWVDEIHDERCYGEGIWVWLKPEYRNYYDPIGLQQIHEPTVRGCIAQFKNYVDRVRPD